jgi:chlorite dismutase
MPQRDPPPTDEGWYVLHDLRTIDWDAWRAAPERERQRAIEEGVAHLQSHVAVEDADEGQSAVYTIVGHKADLMVVYLRPTVAHLETAERRFEQTALADFTEQTSAYLSVTEASGYTERGRDYFEGDLDEDSGLYQYIQRRLHPDIPDSEHVCFYPMSKRRDPEQNWYDLPFDDRAEHMARHGDIGREYGGNVKQMIAGSVGLDDWEWGVTLWADDPTDIKDLLYEMRFDPSSSKFAEFGTFYFGRRFPPADLAAVLAGEPVPTDDDRVAQVSGTASVGHAGDATDGHPHGDSSGGHPHGESAGGASAGDATDGHPHGDADDHSHGHADDQSHGDDSGGHSHDDAAEGSHAGEDESDDSGGGPPGVVQAEGDSAELSSDDDLQQKLAKFGLYPGRDYEEGAVGLLFYSTTPAEELAEEVDDLRGNFEHSDTHVLTTVRANEGQTAVASVWATESAADTASGFLNSLPGVDQGFRGRLGEGDETGGVDTDEADAALIRQQLEDEDIYAGTPHGEDVYALVLYSEADTADLFEEVAGLRENFEHYDTHVKTAVYGAENTDRSAVVSIWDTEDAADTASGFLTDLPGIVGRAQEATSGFGTMGMFYTVKPEHREDFVEKFGEVGDLLAEMDGHRDTALLANHEDENDMFIASQWDAKEDAMSFFRSDAFSETVSWGREVLADRPRHVFLA